MGRQFSMGGTGGCAQWNLLEGDRMSQTRKRLERNMGKSRRAGSRAPHDRQRQSRELVPTAQVDLQARAFKLSELIQESVSRGEIDARSPAVR